MVRGLVLNEHLIRRPIGCNLDAEACSVSESQTWPTGRIGCYPTIIKSITVKSMSLPS